MTEETKAKPVKMETMQAFGRILHNKGIGTEAVCPTAAATAAKQIVAGATFSLEAGATLIVKFQYGISVAAATLAVGQAVDPGSSGYEEKNPAQLGWCELSSGALVATEDIVPASGKTYYTVTTAKPIYYKGADLAADVVKAGVSVMLRYDGTSFNVIGTLGEGNSLTAGDGLDLTNETLSVDDTVARYDPNSSQQVTVPDYAPGTYIGECTTAAATAAKEATVLSYELMNRSSIAMKFTNGISVANATLNVNSKGAKAIYYKGAALAADVIGAGDIALLQYDGTRFNVISIEGAPRYAQVTGKSYYSMTI